MRTKIISLVLLLVAIGMFVQCKGNDDGNKKESDGTKTEVTENDEAIKTDSISKKEKLTKVLTKKEGPHADDIVILTPAFIKAVQKYDELGAFSEGLAAVRRDEGWGYINTKGEEVIPANIEVTCVGRFSEGLAFAYDSYYFYLIDTEGKIVIKSERDKRETLIWEECDGEYNYTENMPYYINGKLYVSGAHSIEDTIHGVTKSKYNVFDNCGNMTTEYIDKIPEDKRIKEEESCRVIKKAKEKIIESAQYDFIQDYSNGVFIAGFVDEHVLEDEYTFTPLYWGYVDLKGNDTFPKKVKKRYRKRK